MELVMKLGEMKGSEMITIYMIVLIKLDDKG